MLCRKQRHFNHNPSFQNFLVRGRKDASSMGTDLGAQGKVKKVLEQTASLARYSERTPIVESLG